MSRDAIDAAGPVVLAVPRTTDRQGLRIYPSQVLLHAPDGGLEVDAVALAEQVRALSKTRLFRRRGALSLRTPGQVGAALPIALDPPGAL